LSTTIVRGLLLIRNDNSAIACGQARFVTDTSGLQTMSIDPIRFSSGAGDISVHDLAVAGQFRRPISSHWLRD
jgi:hypothetical protein